MKSNFSELLDHMEPGELDGVLEGMQDDRLDQMTARRVRRAALDSAGIAARQTKRPRRLRGLVAVAACLALVLGLGTYAYAAENKTYNEAVRFFSENSLSTEGLTRGEIKAVYRDITTESFTYGKTAEVISHSLSTAHVDGYAITQEQPTDTPSREQVMKMWRVYYQGLHRTDVHYAIDYVEQRAEDGTYIGLEKCSVAKYDGQTLLWQTDIRDYFVNRYCPITAGGVMVWGHSEFSGSWQTQYAGITKLDENGNVVWTRYLEDGFNNEYIYAVLEEDDGGYSVVSRGDYKILCFSRYTADGRQTLLKKLDVGNYGVGCVARLGDGYLVQLVSYINNEHARIVKLDHDGNLTEAYSYGGEDAYYYITDMAEFGGRVYLSAYAVPKLEDGESDAGGRYEIAGVLNELERRFSGSGGEWDIPGEELTPLVRENYTALLLVVDPKDGEPETFYSVEGSLGGKLTVDGTGTLTWDVEGIASTFFSPVTSSFTIGGTCQVYRYAFDGSGTLVSQVKTDETTVYRR